MKINGFDVKICDQIDNSLDDLVVELDATYLPDEYVQELYLCLIQLAAEVCLSNGITQHEFTEGCKNIFKIASKEIKAQPSERKLDNSLN